MYFPYGITTLFPTVLPLISVSFTKMKAISKAPGGSPVLPDYTRVDVGASYALTDNTTSWTKY